MKGRVVVVTGSAQGIGAGIALAAAKAGAEALFLIDKDAGGVNVAEDLAKLGPQVAFHQADLADATMAANVVRAAIKRFGRIDNLVNAAGTTDRASFLDGTPELWDRIFAVNARAPYFLMQGAIRDMLARRSPGAIVNIVSINAHCGGSDLAIYSASKGALATLTKNAANAHLADRIRVNGINMGWSATPAEEQMQADTLGHGDRWSEAVAARMPLGRMLTVEEVASLAIFLLSNASGLMTGTVIDMEQRVIGAPG